MSSTGIQTEQAIGILCQNVNVNNDEDCSSDKCVLSFSRLVHLCVYLQKHNKCGILQMGARLFVVFQRFVG